MSIKFFDIFKREKKKEVIVETTHSDLTIHFKCNKNDSWTMSPCKEEDNYWNEFTFWFHNQPEKPFYVMKTDDGESCMRRDDISRYDIRYYKRKRYITE